MHSLHSCDECEELFQAMKRMQTELDAARAEVVVLRVRAELAEHTLISESERAGNMAELARRGAIMVTLRENERDAARPEVEALRSVVRHMRAWTGHDNDQILSLSPENLRAAGLEDEARAVERAEEE